MNRRPTSSTEPGPHGGAAPTRRPALGRASIHVRRLARALAPLVALAIITAALGGCQSGVSARQLSDRAKQLWAQGNYQDAARNFVALTELHPNDALVEESLFWAASIYQQYLGDSEQATRYFQEVLSRFPRGVYQSEARISLAQLYEQDKGTRHRALQLYQQLLQKAPKAEQRDGYQFKVAALNLQMGKLDQARFEFRNLITQFPQSKHLAEAYYLVGYSYYLEKRYPLAVAVFRRTHEKFAGTLLAQQAQFFVADTLEEQGKMREALTAFRALRGKYHNEKIVDKRIENLESRLRRSVR